MRRSFIIMRTRTRTELDSTVLIANPMRVVKKYIEPPGPTEEWYSDTQNSAPIRVDYVVESIVDDPSPGRQFKEVTHTKLLQHVNLGEYERLGNSTNGDGILNTELEFFGRGAHQQCWGNYGNIDFHNVSVQFPIELEKQVRELRVRFYDTNEVDNLVNIVESPGLITGLTSFIRQMIKLKPASFKATKVVFKDKKASLKDYVLRDWKGIRKNARTQASALSGAYLYYSFGIAPLISDMRKIRASVATIKQQLKLNREHAGKVVNLHSSVDGLATLTDMPSTFGSPGQTGKFWDALITGQQPRRTVTVQGIRTRRYETEIFQDLDYLMNRFLSGGPVSYLWERIPYSFVVDWFVDLRDIVNGLDHLLRGSPANIKQTCYSERYNLNVAARKFPQMPHWIDNSSDWTITANNSLSYYHRKPISNDPSITWSGRFGKKQLGLSAALLTQIVSNLRRGSASFR